MLHEASKTFWAETKESGDLLLRATYIGIAITNFK
jgi:hypothetical protein